MQSRLPSLNESLYANINGKSILLEKCPYNDESEFEQIFREFIGQLENTLDMKLTLCDTEVVLPIEGLRIDLLFVDSDEGIPVIVEAKMVSNREIRRKVLGQVLEYLSAIYMYPEIIQNSCKEAVEPETLDKVQERIKEKNIIGIIASDSIPDIVKYTIETLNSDLSRMSIYGFELAKYCNEKENTYVLVPNLIGKTIDSISSGKEKTRKQWEYDEIMSYLEGNLDNETLKEKLKKLLEWADEKGIFVASTTKTGYPAFGLKVKTTGQRVITVYIDGKLDVCYGINCQDKYKSPEDSAKLREEFIRLGLYDENTPTPDKVPYSKRTNSIEKLSDTQFQELINLLEDILVREV